MKELELNGFIAPGHVSTIIGAKPYDVFPRLYKMPTVIAGFEPIDVLFALYMILKQLQRRKPQLENEYVRAVSWNGNTKAQNLMKKIFKVSDGDWRGLGTIPSTALNLKEKHEDYDAHLKYDLGVKNYKIKSPITLSYILFRSSGDSALINSVYCIFYSTTFKTKTGAFSTFNLHIN